MQEKKEINKTKYGFGGIRLFLAILVIFEHSFILGGFGPDPLAQLTGSQISTALLAVMSFFVISGFLVTKSFLQTQNVWYFGLKRALRIMPAFWICLFVVAFGFAPLFYFYENGSLTGYVSSKPTGPFDYILENSFLLIRHYSIGEILSVNPFPNVLNGSLWTLFLEAKAYILIGILGSIGILAKKRAIILFLYVALLIFIASGITTPHVVNPLYRLVLDQYFLIFLCYFLAGSLLYLYRDKITYSLKWSILLTVGASVLFFFDLGRIFLPIALPYLILFSAVHIRPSVFDNKIDLSYGTYIYAFPVMQGLAFFGLNSIQTVYFFLSVLFTLPLALFSWYIIEKPALSIKKLPIFKGNASPKS